MVCVFLHYELCCFRALCNLVVCSVSKPAKIELQVKYEHCRQSCSSTLGHVHSDCCSSSELSESYSADAVDCHQAFL